LSTGKNQANDSSSNAKNNANDPRVDTPDEHLILAGGKIEDSWILALMMYGLSRAEEKKWKWKRDVRGS
jgi:hypothetical protein